MSRIVLPSGLASNLLGCDGRRLPCATREAVIGISSRQSAGIRRFTTG